MRCQTSCMFLSAPLMLPIEHKKERPASDPAEKGFKKPFTKSLGETPSLQKTPKAPIPKAKVSLTEPRPSQASRCESVCLWINLTKDTFCVITVFNHALITWSFVLHEHISLVLHALCSPSTRQPLCKTAGCFLQTLSDPATSYCRSFKPKKEELTTKLYQLYNTSVFDSKVSRTLWNVICCENVFAQFDSSFFFLWPLASRRHVSHLE